MKYVADLDEDTIQELRSQVPPLLMNGLDQYVEHRIRTGGFLEAILKGDLYDTMQKGDLTNLMRIKPIVDYIIYCLPASSYGSAEKVEAWLAEGAGRC